MQKALKALGEEQFGANRWVEHQTLTLKRLNDLCAILDDPDVPIGAVIRPSGVVPASKLQQLVGSVQVLQSEIGQDTGTYLRSRLASEEEKG